MEVFVPLPGKPIDAALYLRHYAWKYKTEHNYKGKQKHILHHCEEFS